jgi:thiamine pyrophosphokinase
MPAEESVARTAVIVIGGGKPDPVVVGHLPDDALIVAADSGFDAARALGLRVDLVVGDLDSISDAGLATAQQSGVPIERHDREKDATDTELAIDAALERGAESLIGVYGRTPADDVRLDHEVATLLTFAHPRLAGRTVNVWWGRASVQVLHGPGGLELAGARGSIVSLLPVHGPAAGITTNGLRYPLCDETLDAGTSRGVSNELLADRASLRLQRGALLVIQPYALGGRVP